jgi:hypothetical protein
MQCISTIRKKTKTGIYKDVPCGRCNYCLANNRKQWSYRLQKEFKKSISAYFVTLTYDDQNMPITFDENDNPYPVLDKDDFQKFMKRIRKEDTKIKYEKGLYHYETDKNGTKKKVLDNRLIYYSVGEYGSNNLRPHYHIILFNLFRDDLIVKHWNKGHVDVGTVSLKSINYVTKYVINKYEMKGYFVPPFALISKGIGREHFEENRRLFANAKTVVNEGGFKQSMPRYYKKMLGKTNVDSDINYATSKRVGNEQVDKERKRLAKIHNDLDTYMEERSLVNHDKITRNAKKGDKL